MRGVTLIAPGRETMIAPQNESSVYLMKQKLELIPLRLSPPEIVPPKPWGKKLHSALIILLQIEIEKKKRRQKKPKFWFQT